MSYKSLSFVLLIVFIILLTACGGNNINRINGEWRCDVEGTLALGEEHADPQLEQEVVHYKLLIDVSAEEIAITSGKYYKKDHYIVVDDNSDFVTLQTKDFLVDIEFVNNNTIVVWIKDDGVYVWGWVIMVKAQS